jgi:hypothetical protein
MDPDPRSLLIPEGNRRVNHVRPDCRGQPIFYRLGARRVPGAQRSLLEMENLQKTDALRFTVALVALLNLCYFGVEFAVALTIGSVSLFADSIDFLEDGTVNGLILVALGWNARRRSMVGMFLAAVLFAPAAATLWTAWQKLHLHVPPATAPVPRGVGCASDQPVLCFSSRPFPNSWWQPNSRGLPLRPKRCAGKCRDHRCRGCYGRKSLRVA